MDLFCNILYIILNLILYGIGIIALLFLAILSFFMVDEEYYERTGKRLINFKKKK